MVIRRRQQRRSKGGKPRRRTTASGETADAGRTRPKTTARQEASRKSW
jgi:hypothetical protein